VWVFLTDSFLSIVAHRDRPGDLLVRARRQGDIENVFPSAEVSLDEHADYPWRAVISREDVADALAAQAREIGCTNFKAAVMEPERHDVYMSIWSQARRLEKAVKG
jgi:hypothetical protein